MVKLAKHYSNEHNQRHHYVHKKTIDSHPYFNSYSKQKTIGQNLYAIKKDSEPLVDQLITLNNPNGGPF